jgi:hypothetical protein
VRGMQKKWLATDRPVASMAYYTTGPTPEGSQHSGTAVRGLEDGRPTYAGHLHSPSLRRRIAGVVVAIPAGLRDQKWEDVRWFAA